MRKNIISIMMAIIMVLGVFSITAFAEDATLTASEPQNINTEAKTMDVTQPSELLWVTEHSANAKRTDIPKTFSGWTINITNDITWSGEWTPITNFHGKMIGATNEAETDYITISGLHVTTASNNAALCGKVEYNEGNGAPTFKNIRIADSKFITNGEYAGAFVGNGYTATFTNCHVLDCEIYADRFVGGIAGTTYGNIERCSVTGTTKAKMTITAKTTASVLGTGDNAGGIVGLMGEGGTKVTACTVNNVTIHATRQAGGIAGLANYGDYITGCFVSNVEVKVYLNSNRVTFKRSAAAGGVCGQIQTGSSVVHITGNTVGPDVSVSQENGSTRYCGWAVGDVTRAQGDTSLYDISNSEVEGWTSPINEIGA